ncbi:hypothetical protein HPQ64_06110 [Rhizobiales bacterium]|uniref:c-type cytochrome n=1 Tax=Hongsoonwoonella zoysiae TaxID=2821844 RepID=UPI0015601149|nr:hypothetical protein [Hongsoonwoonella zoysiae]NRG17254.1 hypothetical protein [Hongsoonwoonella zoysiae]
MLRAIIFISMAVALSSSPALSQGIDPHALYEERCAGCHAPHAPDLANESLELRGAQLVAKGRDKPLDAFLQSHRRTELSTDELDVLVTHFSTILRSGGLYRDKCIICHERAREFARTYLIERENRILGRYSDRDIETFLAGHGRLDPDEAITIVEIFSRQLDNFEQPAKP